MNPAFKFKAVGCSSIVVLFSILKVFCFIIEVDLLKFLRYSCYFLSQVILGSSSVARKKILADMGYQFTTMVCRAA